MHYRIVAPTDVGAAKILRETLAALRQEKAMQADLVRLEKVCCAPENALVRLGAPTPAIVEDTGRI